MVKPETKGQAPEDTLKGTEKKNVFCLCVWFVGWSWPVCFLKRERKKVWNWMAREVERIWEEMEEKEL